MIPVHTQLTYQSHSSIRSSILRYIFSILLTWSYLQFQNVRSIHCWSLDFIFSVYFQEKCAGVCKMSLKPKGVIRELPYVALESKHAFKNRTNTSQFIKDVDFAFKGVQVRIFLIDKNQSNSLSRVDGIFRIGCFIYHLLYFLSCDLLLLTILQILCMFRE